MRSKPLAKTIIGLCISLLAVTGCTSLISANNQPSTANPDKSTNELASFGFENMQAAEIIDLLEATPLAERSSDFLASVRPKSLTLSDQTGKEISLEMPADRFYVSIAPYTEQTHDCYFHSLTTCVGEIRGETLTVIVNDDEGNELLNKETKTADNGFIGLWLPRDIQGTLTIEHDGLSTELPLSTGDSDPTCITTARLS